MDPALSPAHLRSLVQPTAAAAFAASSLQMGTGAEQRLNFRNFKCYNMKMRYCKIYKILQATMEFACWIIFDVGHVDEETLSPTTCNKHVLSN